jgi:two-component system response regulator (stage 0 sporulation protein F)
MNNNGEKGVILVVDDEKEVTMSLKGFFTALGYDMLTALDGNEAMNVINSIKNLDLILLDVKMPGVDGIQILKHLRKNNSKAKVIIMTAYDKDVKQEVEKAGIDGFFAKPIDLSKLIDRIRYLIEDPDKDTRVYPTKEKAVAVSKKIPRAKLLFIEPSVEMHAFTSALFNNPDFCSGEYERKAIYFGIDNLSGIILHELMAYQPDIVLINDYAMSEGDILNMIDLIDGVKIKPDEIIIHGLFERSSIFETRLKMKKVKRCIQNTMDHQQLIEMNKKLIDFVNNECIDHGLVKK